MDTICAVATGHGGAIGIIRVSGDDALTIADKIFTPANGGIRLSERKGFSIAYGTVSDGGGAVVDDVLVSVFRSPHSYTGENSVEISCHGSVYVLQTVMRLLIDNGCRAAEPGEYTRRAFTNGKMDLSQAEAVADLIASSTAAAHRMAMSQMRGAFSKQLQTLRSKLLNIASLMELELDFSDHDDIQFADRGELDTLSADVETTVSSLAASFSTGNAIKNGVPVAIIGAPNVGKSTLLNALVGDERAIVSDISGTTRDTVEDNTVIGGIRFRIIDTAGLRHTTDKIESLGIERSLKAMANADIVLAVCAYGDGSAAQLYDRLRPHIEGKKAVLVINKCDKAGTDAPLSIDKQAYGDGWSDVVPISALHLTNIDRLETTLVSLVDTANTGTEDVVVTNVRHYEALVSALEDIRRVRQGIASGTPSDLVCEDLRQCLRHLGAITGGEITSQETLNNIFSHFCIGK